MEITKKNFKEIVPKEEQNRLSSLFDDLEDINKYGDMNLFIDWQDWHDEYYCERTDPCPDYYGYYTLRFEKMPYDTVGGVMTINELDSALFILYRYNYLLYGEK